MRAIRARVYLALEHVEIEFRARRFGMLLGIRRHGDFEVADGLEAGDEIRGVREAVRARLILDGARRRIATQRDDVADALVPVLARDIQHLASRLAPMQVRCGTQVSCVSFCTRDTTL